MSGVPPLPALARAVIDRAATRRRDPAWLNRAWADPRSRVLTVRDGLAPVVGDPPRLLLSSPPPTVVAPERYFLGLDDAGVAYFATPAAGGGSGSTASTGDTDPVRMAGLREVGALLSDLDAGLLTHAVALDNWHATHGRCARCGAQTRVEEAGHMRRCPACGAEHYPRTDPAVIMLVTDGEDRALLGRQSRWPARRFSTLAGFVEPGESLEQAVVREVAEEVGLAVTDVRYVASQPWPFPSSLMLAFTARSEGSATTVDGEEIAEAIWLARDELAEAVAGGRVLLPPPVSIAYRLISGWYGGELAAGWEPLGSPA